ncbi:MAG TPA: PAS domain-containing protein [Candidatus Acidoferrum sp.]|nr:PAS domain-containing protein [Candidatus Acidoferrum sp.]
MKATELAFRLLVVFLLLPAISGAQPKPVRRVLIFYEMGLSSPTVGLVDQELRDASAKAPYQIEPYHEYLETILFPDPVVQQEFLGWYIRKYRDRRPDLIIALGPSPLKFLLEAHEKFFADVPIVFGGAAELEADNPRLDTHFTGVWERFDPEKTLEAALRLQPNTRSVVVVGGMSPFDRRLEAFYKERLHSYESKLDFTYLTDLDMTSLLEELKHLPPRTVVLYTHFGLDAKGTPYVGLSEAGPLISAAANAPVFNPSDLALGHGEVGGYLASSPAEARMVGEIAARVLTGEKPQDIPTATVANAYTFDWRALQRWGLNERNLPPGSIVLNREPTFWEAYRRYVVSGTLLLLAQATIIIALLLQWTKRKKTQEALALVNERLQLAMEAARASSWHMDLKTGLATWSGTWQNMFGDSANMCSAQIMDLSHQVHSEDRQRVSEALNYSRERREPFAVEFRLPGPGGETRWFSARGKFDYQSNGDAVQVLGMAVDVTDRRQAEEAVRESEQRFRLVADKAPVMIWMCDTDKRCTYCNQPWLEFTGRSLEAELGNGWMDGIHPDDLERCLDILTKAFDRREPFHMEYRYRRHDGGYRWLHDMGVPRCNTDSFFSGYIGSCLDVTERKLAEDALSTVSRRLIEAHEEERAWLARELHDDVNQRLALFAVALDIVKRGIPESLTEARQSIGEITKELRDLGNDVQALSHRLHSAKLEYLGLVSVATSFCKELSDRKGVQIDFHCGEIPTTLPKDISLCLYRVLQEALQNAVKHSGSRQFQVSLTCTLDKIHLTVRDSGIGFNSEEAMGRGLGLVSMRERLKLVDGELSIDSQVHKGTEVRAAIPLNSLSMSAGVGKT